MIHDDFGMHGTGMFLFLLMLLLVIVLVLGMRSIELNRPYLRNCARGE